MAAIIVNTSTARTSVQRVAPVIKTNDPPWRPRFAVFLLPPNDHRRQYVVEAGSGNSGGVLDEVINLVSIFLRRSALTFQHSNTEWILPCGL